MFKIIEEGHSENDANHVRTDAPQSGGESMGRNSTVEFKRLYDSSFQILLKVAYRITNNWEAAEDICQDSFFRLYERNMAFPNMEEGKYWLIRVVKNGAINYARRKAKERLIYQRAFREDHRKEETGEGILVKKETSEEVKSALEKLPERLRMVLILKEYADMNYREIGKVLGISEGNVKVRMFRAREKLASLLVGSPLAESLNLPTGDKQPNIDLQGGKNVS
ncbi:RNA polymerase subunit sigma-24 [Treponema sp. R8-4-B8]